ncbi:N-glycosylase/DNA lyase [Parachaetomium inaequale]|uniref:DNA-(apurinic or apyrimidinic site) lyase n=1 Tax=Parachaetomium inaequale TaxID=2588326 RepID=A0AAN6PIR4_9PEZI|nr:N-glycosylase/DNA lyase [Parachaetomium inaequale]
MGAKVSDWRKLPLSLSELCIETTLRCGQSFRWRKIEDEWHCVLRGRLVSLKQDSSHLHYRVTWPTTASSPRTLPASAPSACLSPPPAKGKDSEEDDTTSLLHNYFALSLSVSSLYKQWAASDTNFARRAPAFTGIRILNQDAWEALVAFICSSNNNISRISSMVQKLCLHYGPYIGTIEGEPFHDFPGPEALAGSQVEANLRQLGFGYRARYIAETAHIVSSVKSPGWLLRLRNPACPALGEATTTIIKSEPVTQDVKPNLTPKPEQTDPPTKPPAEVKQEPEPPAPPPTYRTAHEALLTLPGVGPKVADCVCLMGLGWGEAVPVDTHVWQIAQRDYSLGKGTKSKTFTKTMYDAVGEHFRRIWGPHAGWAQSVLFTANLKAFKGQASNKGDGADGKKGEEEEEGGVVGSEGKSLESATSDHVTGAVKVEDGREEVVTETKTTSRKSRKRKVVAVAQDSGDDKTQVKVAEVEVVTRRTSKRIKYAAR